MHQTASASAKKTSGIIANRFGSVAGLQHQILGFMDFPDRGRTARSAPIQLQMGFVAVRQSAEYKPTTMDRLLIAADGALRTLFARPNASRPLPTAPLPSGELDEAQKRLSGALMRVNHVGEVCAQALYAAQAATTRNPELRVQFEAAAREESDHLAWTRERLDELGSRPSVLNPLWYAGAFALGLVAGRLGDRVSLGFVVETERQVEAHLQGHLNRLPSVDHASRAIVAQMKEDEARHAAQAQRAGAMELPNPAKALMRAAARVMTTTAHYL